MAKAMLLVWTSVVQPYKVARFGLGERRQVRKGVTENKFDKQGIYACGSFHI